MFLLLVLFEDDDEWIGAEDRSLSMVQKLPGFGFFGHIARPFLCVYDKNYRLLLSETFRPEGRVMSLSA